MKKLISALLLLAAFPLLMAGGSEISGMIGVPSLPRAITLTLASQIVLFAAGGISPPRRGRMGFFRAVAFTFYCVESLPIPVFLFALIKKEFSHVDLVDSNQLIWGLAESFCAFTLLLISGKAWHLFGRAARA